MIIRVRVIPGSSPYLVLEPSTMVVLVTSLISPVEPQKEIQKINPYSVVKIKGGSEMALAFCLYFPSYCYERYFLKLPCRPVGTKNE